MECPLTCFGDFGPNIVASRIFIVPLPSVLNVITCNILTQLNVVCDTLQHAAASTERFP